MSGLLQAGYLHWYPNAALKSGFPHFSFAPGQLADFTNYSFSFSDCVFVFDHFLGWYVIAKMAAHEVVNLFIDGLYDEGLHGAFSHWGLEKRGLNVTEFWNVARSDLALNIDWKAVVLEHDAGTMVFAHPIGHAVFIIVASELADVRPPSFCHYPVKYHFMNHFPISGVLLCQKGPRAYVQGCILGFFDSAHQWIQVWPHVNMSELFLKKDDLKTACAYARFHASGCSF